ncbi:MAG: retron system putative HNH endonuclease [Byssovorax sp.]
MRRIEKGPEPACLADLRGTPGADWSTVTGAQKQELRERSFAEQHGLCAYCMSKLPSPPSSGSMTIEHFETRALVRSRTFDWNNLLGVCLGDVGVKEGGDGDLRERFHCDNYRGKLHPEKQELGLHPAAFPPDVGPCFTYSIQGEIRANRKLPEPLRARTEKTIERLNLNIARLKRNRAEVIEKLRAELQKKSPKPARVKALLDLASGPDAKGQLMPYSQTAVDYLTRKLRQLAP